MTPQQARIRFAGAVAVTIVTIWSTAVAAPPAASTSSTSTDSQALGTHEPRVGRFLYAVNQAVGTRGSVSVYDIGAEHRPVKTIETVHDVDDVKGVVASAATGRLYVAYRTRSDVGMIYCFNLYDDEVLWNRAIDPDIDRLAIHPDGQLLYIPTWEGRSADFINVLDASTGDVVRKVHFSSRSHDAQFPLSGPLFQETKAGDGSGKYLYLIDPQSYAVSRVGPYAGILGPYAVDGMSRYVVNNVTGLWGMQVAELKSGRIVTANIEEHPAGEPGMLHGIGWTPDQREVWQSSSEGDPHIYIWSMRDPMAPVLAERLSMKSRHGAHWLTFDIEGDYAYVAPKKGSDDATEIFDAHTHKSVGLIGSSEDMIEIDFADRKVSRVGDQFGVGRVVHTSKN